ncbi:MAG: glycerophosphodiester phosphodiesterase [Eubacterium sp.]|nr:glycerophosphodiester phosphodiesterase [Eubacterium sp.]
MPEKKLSRRERFKRFLKRNMTPLWAKRFSYQVISFLVSVAMVVGVAMYAFTKSYDERTLSFTKGFTITAHAGAFNTSPNSLETVNAAIEHGVDILEVDIRQRPDGTVVMGHDIITTNNDGVEVTLLFETVKPAKIKLNLDIKDTRSLPMLHDLIFEYGLEKRVFLTGIESFQANTAAEKCPGIDYYINYSPSRFKIFSEDYQEKLLGMLEETGGIGINCNHAYASKTLCDMLHDHGYKLSVWTADKKYHIKRMLIIKPDNITTRQVELLQSIIDNWGKKK